MLTLDLDYNVVRKAIINAIQSVTGLDQDHVVVLEAEAPNSPRPTLPYMSMKIINPGARYGDDDKRNVPGPDGKPSTFVNSGGPRKMSVSFNSYGRSHEEAYNFMVLWQTALDEENLQMFLRKAGIAVWLPGNVVDLSALLNTGYEGRAQMDCQFGVAVNVQSDLGEIDTVPIGGTVKTDQGTVTVPTTNITV